MITTQDQDELFQIIANKLPNDIECIAFGGTAMMFKNYKRVTKDIDLVFYKEADRDNFIRVIESLGYAQKNSLINIYSEKKQQSNNKPLMFTRGEERFDLFCINIFKTTLSLAMIKRATHIRDYNKKSLFRIKILSDEDLVLLKSITNREKDFEDIKDICNLNKQLDWQVIIKEAIEQAKNADDFILLDLEETMKKLKEHIFLKQELFDKLYKAM